MCDATWMADLAGDRGDMWLIVYFELLCRLVPPVNPAPLKDLIRHATAVAQMHEKVFREQIFAQPSAGSLDYLIGPILSIFEV